MGITNDNITVSHVIEVGTPQTPDADSTTLEFKKIFSSSSDYTLDLKDFPHEILPSGGLSGVLSLSEMIVCKVTAYDYPKGDDMVYFDFYHPDGHKIVTLQGGDGYEEPQWTSWWSSDWGLIGHFGWEIDTPGNYWIIVRTPWGNARVDYTVIDTTPQPKKYANVVSVTGGYLRTYVDDLWMGDAGLTMVRVLLEGHDKFKLEAYPAQGYHLKRIEFTWGTTTSYTPEWNISSMPLESDFLGVFEQDVVVPASKDVYYYAVGNGYVNVKRNGVIVLQVTPAAKGMIKVTVGDTIALYAYPDTGWHFKKHSWVGGESTSQNISIHVNQIGEIQNTTTTFEKNADVTKTLTFKVQGAGLNKIFLNGSFEAVAQPTQNATLTIKRGDVLRQEASPDSGWKFLKHCDCIGCSTQQNLSTTITDPLTYCDWTTFFEQIQQDDQTFTMTASTQGAGKKGNYITELNLHAPGYPNAEFNILRRGLISNEPVASGTLNTAGRGVFQFEITKDQTLVAVLPHPHSVHSNDLTFEWTPAGDDGDDGDDGTDSGVFKLSATKTKDIVATDGYYTTISVECPARANNTVFVAKVVGMDFDEKINELSLDSAGKASFEYYITPQDSVLGDTSTVMIALYGSLWGIGCMTDGMLGDCIKSNKLKFTIGPQTSDFLTYAMYGLAGLFGLTALQTLRGK